MLPLLPGAYNISGEALEPATAQQHFTAFPFSPRVSSLESAPRKPAYITAPQTARKEERRQSGLPEHPAFAKRCVMHAAANHQQPTTFLLIQFHFISFLLEHHKRREPFNASKAFKVFGRLSLVAIPGQDLCQGGRAACMAKGCSLQKMANNRFAIRFPLLSRLRYSRFSSLGRKKSKTSTEKTFSFPDALRYDIQVWTQHYDRSLLLLWIRHDNDKFSQSPQLVCVLRHLGKTAQYYR